MKMLKIDAKFSTSVWKLYGSRIRDSNSLHWSQYLFP